ncbi:MAG: metal-sensitive transcriptional regulator [Actinomycetota bacterium]
MATNPLTAPGLCHTEADDGATASATAPTIAPATTPSPPGPHGYSPERDAYLARMRRIEGQVRGIERMIASDTYCIDVLTQISAVTRALQAVSLGLLEDHLNHCVVEAAKASDAEGQAKVAEATAAIARLWKS